MLNEIAIGLKISDARKKNGLSQSQLADILMVTPQAVSKWERGESLPDILTLNRMTAALGVDLNYFSGAEPALAAASPRADTPEPDAGAVKKPVCDMSMTSWKNADFAGLQYNAEKFNFANVENCGFAGARLSNCQFKGNNIGKNDFSGADLSGGRFSGSNIEKNKLDKCSLAGAAFWGCNLDCNGMAGADFTNAALNGCNFDKNDVSGAVWKGASFKSCNISAVFDGGLSDCSFVGCPFGKSEFRGVAFANVFFKNCKLQRAVFTDCRADKLTYAFLSACKADLSGIEKID